MPIFSLLVFLDKVRHIKKDKEGETKRRGYTKRQKEKWRESDRWRDTGRNMGIVRETKSSDKDGETRREGE
jgi:hypothetical protein